MRETSGALFSGVDYVLHLFPDLVSIFHQLLLHFPRCFLILRVTLQLLQNSLEVGIHLPLPFFNWRVLYLIVVNQYLLAHNVEVMWVLPILETLLLAVNMFSRREHLIAKVTVSILHVGIVVMPHK